MQFLWRATYYDAAEFGAGCNIIALLFWQWRAVRLRHSCVADWQGAARHLRRFQTQSLVGAVWSEYCWCHLLRLCRDLKVCK